MRCCWGLPSLASPIGQLLVLLIYLVFATTDQQVAAFTSSLLEAGRNHHSTTKLSCLVANNSQQCFSSTATKSDLFNRRYHLTQTPSNTDLSANAICKVLPRFRFKSSPLLMSQGEAFTVEDESTDTHDKQDSANKRSKNLRSTLRAITGFSLTSLRATLRVATGVSISGALKRMIGVFPIWVSRNFCAHMFTKKAK
jgi:hypothetical protein